MDLHGSIFYLIYMDITISVLSGRCNFGPRRHSSPLLHDAHHASHVHTRRQRQQSLYSEGAIPSLYSINRMLNPIQKLTDSAKITKSAHPGSSPPRVVTYPSSRRPFISARFSPDDKFSRHRVTIKKRYGILPTQLPAIPM